MHSALEYHFTRIELHYKLIHNPHFIAFHSQIIYLTFLMPVLMSLWKKKLKWRSFNCRTIEMFLYTLKWKRRHFAASPDKKNKEMPFFDRFGNEFVRFYGVFCAWIGICTLLGNRDSLIQIYLFSVSVFFFFLLFFFSRWNENYSERTEPSMASGRGTENALAHRCIKLCINTKFQFGDFSSHAFVYVQSLSARSNVCCGGTLIIYRSPLTIPYRAVHNLYNVLACPSVVCFYHFELSIHCSCCYRRECTAARRRCFIGVLGALFFGSPFTLIRLLFLSWIACNAMRTLCGPSRQGLIHIQRL